MEIGLLEKLTRLNLSRNRINELPDEFFRLRELKYLNLSHNGLEDISADLSDLVMLEFLDLSNNQLEQLPGGIGFLTRLTDLSIHHNKLQALPSDITNLRSELWFCEIWAPLTSPISCRPSKVGHDEQRRQIYARIHGRFAEDWVYLRAA